MLLWILKVNTNKIKNKNIRIINSSFECSNSIYSYKFAFWKNKKNALTNLS